MLSLSFSPSLSRSRSLSVALALLSFSLLPLPVSDPYTNTITAVRRTLFVTRYKVMNAKVRQVRAAVKIQVEFLKSQQCSRFV